MQSKEKIKDYTMHADRFLRWRNDDHLPFPFSCLPTGVIGLLWGTFFLDALLYSCSRSRSFRVVQGPPPLLSLLVAPDLLDLD